jgi:hypothetical protein
MFHISFQKRRNWLETKTPKDLDRFTVMGRSYYFSGWNTCRVE